MRARSGLSVGGMDFQVASIIVSWSANMHNLILISFIPEWFLYASPIGDTNSQNAQRNNVYILGIAY